MRRRAVVSTEFDEREQAVLAAFVNATLQHDPHVQGCLPTTADGASRQNLFVAISQSVLLSKLIAQYVASDRMRRVPGWPGRAAESLGGCACSIPRVHRPCASPVCLARVHLTCISP